jgi:hypothetical protein
MPHSPSTQNFQQTVKLLFWSKVSRMVCCVKGTSPSFLGTFPRARLHYALPRSNVQHIVSNAIILELPDGFFFLIWHCDLIVGAANMFRFWYKWEESYGNFIWARSAGLHTLRVQTQIGLKQATVITCVCTYIIHIIKIIFTKECTFYWT